MSVAIAVARGQEIALATDSMIHFGGEKVPAANLSDTKMIKVGSAWLAATGWTLYSNIFDEWLGANAKKLPPLTTEANIFRFFNLLWKGLHDTYSFVRDQPSDHDSPFGDLDSTFLIVSPGGIFHVASDLSVTRFQRYFAIGSGASLAMGAVHAVYDSASGVDVIADTAVEAAIAHDLYCGGPVNLQQLKVRATQARATPARSARSTARKTPRRKPAAAARRPR